MNAATIGGVLLGIVGLAGGGAWVHGVYFSQTPDPPFTAPATGDVDTDAWIDVLRHENYNNPKNFSFEAPDGTLYTRDRREAAMHPTTTPWVTQ